MSNRLIAPVLTATACHNRSEKSPIVGGITSVIKSYSPSKQLAVAGLASTYQGLIVWAASTLALMATMALGISAGQRLLKRLPLKRIHQFSGVLFLLPALVALHQAVT